MLCNLSRQAGDAKGLSQAALVSDVHADRDRLGRVDASQDLGAVGELCGDVGADEARDLEPANSRSGELVNEPDLVVGRDQLGLVLKAIAGSDLADRHVIRQRRCCHGHNRKMP